MITTRVEVSRTVSGGVLVTVSQWERRPGRRYAHLLQKPWEHYLTMPEGVSEADVFRTVRKALRDLKMDEPLSTTAEGGPAPLEGPRGGVSQ